jgi:peptidoglycan/LPS O-acetylase OafA/YrhL
MKQDIAEGEVRIASHAEGPPVAARFVVLDGVRGVAAIMVLILHSAFIFPNAFLAVDLFFVLSGFVLAHGYGEKLDRGGGRKHFVLARLIRLYPLYLLGCAIALPAAIGIAIYGWSYFNLPVLALAVVTAPFFIPLPYDGYTIPLNPPGWSLTFELIANMLFLFVGTRLSRVAPIVAASAALLLWGMAAYDGPSTGWLSFLGAFPRTFFSFFAGVLLYRLWQDGVLPRVSIPALLVLAIVVMMCVVEPRHYRNYHAIAVFVIAPAIIWLGASSSAHPLVERLCDYFGTLSYGVYVLHVPIIMTAEGLRFLILGASVTEYQPTGATAWVTIPLSFVAAHFLTFRFDIPMRKLLAGSILRRPDRSAQS